MRLLISLLTLAFTTIGLPALHVTERTASAATPSGVHSTPGRKKKRAGRPQKAKKAVKKNEKATKKNDRGFEL